MSSRSYPSVAAALWAAVLCGAGLVATGLLAYELPVFKITTGRPSGLRGSTTGA
jgi:hypothetical protein